MSSPDRQYVKEVGFRGQIRVELGKTKGDVDWFIVQLEYNHGPFPNQEDDWEQVARFDHQPQMSWGHDIREEGLHLDLYENGQKVEREMYYAEFPVNKAPQWCEAHLEEYADHYLAQYEIWHGAAEAQLSE